MTLTRGARRAPHARRPLLVGLTLAVLGPTPTLAGSLRLADVLAEVRARNPDIQAAQARSEAAAAVAPRVGALDDPTFSYEAWNAPSARLDRADNNIFKLAQKLPFPGKRGFARRVAERDAESVRSDAAATALDVETAAKRAYFDLWQAHEELAIYERERELVRRYERLAEARYASGAVAQSDALQATIEVARLEGRVATGVLAVDSAAAELNALQGRPADAAVARPADEPRPALHLMAEALTTQALATRPEVAGAEAMVAREESGVLLAGRDRYPDFEVAVSRFLNEGQRDGFGAMVSVSIPIANRRKYDAAAAEARARLAAAEAARRRVADRVRLEVRQAWVRARTAAALHALAVGTHVPRAEQALRVAESGYEAGTVDFARLIESARAIEMVHLEHVEAAATFEKAFADLERAVGTTIPREERP
jgi:outer membrane protein TolC